MLRLCGVSETLPLVDMTPSPMMRALISFRSFTAILLALLLSSSPVCQGQGLGDLFQLGDAVGKASTSTATVTARLEETADTGAVKLLVTVKLPPGANTYSQSPSFAKPTKVTVTAPAGLSPLGGDFTPDRAPKVEFDENFGKEVEKFVGEVTFSRRFLLPQGLESAQAELAGKIDFLMCDKDNCAPQSVSFTARLEPAPPPAVNTPAPIEDLGAPPALVMDLGGPTIEDIPPAAGLTNGYLLVPTRGAERDPVDLAFWLDREIDPAGGEMLLGIRMRIEPGWKTYGLQPAGPDQVERPTELKLLELSGLEPVGDWGATPAPKVHRSEESVANAHEGEVIWSQRLRVTGSGSPGVRGTIRYQLCRDVCLPPKTVSFSLGTLQQADDVVAATALTERIEPPTGGGGLDDGLAVEDTAGAANADLAWILFITFLGGILLNVMPCVLPVVAIKILSFVQQAGESRLRILLLNLAYTVGVLAVFFALAGLSVTFSMAFGDLFQLEAFNLVMMLIVFAMGLSLLGVFELPISGILPSSTSHQEGLTGAFWTGIIATLLATPCTAGVMVTPLAFLKDQPPHMSFIVFGMMGLGMAFPYLLAGVFPAVVKLIPKPGAWMVKFKQFCGFVLLGTVIFLMNSLPDEKLIGICIVLLGVALAIWMLTNLNDYGAPFSARVKTALLTAVVCGPIIWWGFTPKFEAQPFSEARMLALREQGKPMLIDFTADWCGICKTNELVALNRSEAQQFIAQHGFEFMVADFTQEDPEIRKWLNTFGQENVPLTVIIPPGKDSKVIALRGAYTLDILMSKLRQAVAGTEEPVVSLGAPESMSAGYAP